tara:strand:+ start:212 stop:886 length:675 start_codon:yes stop_codon:yes gene_type:complete
MLDTPGNIFLFSSVAALIVGIILIDYLKKRKSNEYLIKILIVFFSSIPLNLLSQFIYYQTVFTKFEYLSISALKNGGIVNKFNDFNFADFFIRLFWQSFSLEKFYVNAFNPRWIFIVLNSILILIIIYLVIVGIRKTKGIKNWIIKKMTSIVSWFMKQLKYPLLLLVSKPFLTFFIYPKVIRRDLGSFEPLGFHIENIFSYELITFVYSFVFIVLVYLFIPKKK